MDPCGPQKKIKSDGHHVGFQKLVSGGGGDGSYGGGFPTGGKMKKVSSGEAYDQDQGKVRGKTKHTYGSGD